MTKRAVLDEIKRAYRLKRGAQSALARILGINRCAISHWADDKPIPAIRRVQLKRKFPELFQHYSDEL